MTSTDDRGRTHRVELRAALAWLTHPVTAGALVVLVLNDHLLKRVYGTWWTGKLSDVAGLVLAPALVGVALAAARSWRGSAHRARPDVVADVATIVVGVAFVVVKITALGAATASAAWTAVAGPSVVLRDPTDLLALPALVLGWVVARSSATHPHDRATRRWPLVLPLAVLATAATSSMGAPGTMSVDVTDGVLVVGTGWSEQATSLFSTTDAETWTDLGYVEHTPEPTDSGSPLPTSDPAAATACVPDEPDVCYRATQPETLGVSRSDDGGRTWEPEWSLTDEELSALTARLTDSEPIETLDVAVLPTAAGYRVYAANGGDGLAERDEDGTWTRLGQPYLGDGPAPLPGEAVVRTYPVPLAVLFGALVATIATAVIALPARRRLEDGRTIAIAPGVVAALLALVAVLLDFRLASFGSEIGYTIFGQAVVVLALVGAVVLGLVAIALAGRTLGVGVALGALVGVVTAMVIAWLPGSDAQRVVIGLLVAAMGTAGCAIAVRRLGRGPDEPPVHGPGGPALEPGREPPQP
ncbi:hypothetical protein [Cellulomonas composti]|uniref:Uncharacterized protein n=1 Tax=Cellulomonas composti TaxID=266130 RepID=A0A511J809_9CELL|nr:hypothetical protein [Cellulomonas composti]GEL94132.1 hypothetical protein CCO02nite_07900 [Cellulomonas composti]